MKTKWGDEVPAIDKAIEECAEVLQVLMKIKRFGFYDRHPETSVRNNDKLASEMLDFLDAIENLRWEERGNP